MEGVYWVKLDGVYNIQAHELALLHLNWIAVVVERLGIYGIGFVLAVKVRVKGIHNHDKFLRSLRAGVIFGIDKIRTIKAMIEMLRDGKGMAVIEMQTKWGSLEFVGEAFAGQYEIVGHRAIHFRRMETVEVHRVWFGTIVCEIDTNEVAFGGADCGAWHLSVVCPRRKYHTGSNFDVLIFRSYPIFAKHTPTRSPCLLINFRAFFRRQVI